eukprot:TRINITY_DN7137_c0_g1_i1.p3 TRINITY_DN7137_c0_g1~~TRINITY_DN7137_c0_g1_i1.p3  ORF type:complete len:160 (-),score=62.28 TRINITY_DN7137_c0_g1_i1:164-643(-)
MGSSGINAEYMGMILCCGEREHVIHISQGAQNNNSLEMEQKALKLTPEMLNTEKLLTTELHKMNILSNAISNLKNAQGSMSKATEEIAKLSEGARIYKPVGRMFVLMGKDEMVKDFEKNSKVIESDIKENEDLLTQCKTKSEELKKGLGDMIKKSAEPA